MRMQSTTGGPELLLGVIAIRLAVLVGVGWSLTLLPQPARHRETTCATSPATTTEARPSATAASPRISDPALEDMLRHD